MVELKIFCKRPSVATLYQQVPSHQSLLTLNLLVLGHARDEVAAEQKVDNVHLVSANEAFRVPAHFKRAEPLEKRLNKVLRRRLARELGMEALCQIAH